MTTVNSLPHGHVVAAAPPTWSHVKPLCALLVKIVRLRRVYATMFTSTTLLDKVNSEVARQFLPEGEEHLKSLIRVVALPTSPLITDTALFNAEFSEGYKTLYARKPIAAAPNSERVYDAVEAPQLAVLDYFMYDTIADIRSVSGTSVPIYAWQSGGVGGGLFLFGPERYGGNGDMAVKIAAITAEDEEIRKTEKEKIYRRIRDELVELPGIPPMYDYEFSPQIVSASSIPPAKTWYLQYVSPLAPRRMFSESDGIIAASNRLYEGPVFDAWQEWYGSRPVIGVGPISPLVDVTSLEREKAQSPLAGEVNEFLDKALEKFGKHSVVLVSFGTHWWSSEPEKIWAVLDVLIELQIPFLFSHASPFATVPEEVKQKVTASGLGLMSSWLPQQLILHHEACGWFVTHCGHNSVMEALTEGIPLICWPFEIDQPINAANISLTHNAGYELLEVRTGHGLRPLHRLGGRAPEGTIAAVRREAAEVFTKARGEDGAEKRANAQKFAKAFAQYWEEGGEGWKELKKVVDVLF
ncbi:hypothetical protein M0805_004054 [Coniferiporia weirii]|nr:hypothetical protein M0805_004054 [Coniferiporia weirii]